MTYYPTLIMPNTNHQTLLNLTDQCVKCGLCLSSCPTYQVYNNEADSPRGRITLIQGLLNGDITANDSSLKKHLDQCLSCGNCETACPSGVKYSFVFDNVKSQFKLRTLPKWQLNFLSSPLSFRVGMSLAQFIPRSFSAVTPGFFGKLLRNKPSQSYAIEKNNKNTGTKGKIGIFTGCVGKTTDAKAINQTVELLEHFGYSVDFLSNQTCCGAMHQHEGYTDQSESLQNNNIATFNNEKIDHLIYFASGCGAQLLAYQDKINVPISDATQFIASILPESFTYPSSQQKVVLHAPCTQRNKTNSWADTLNLLKKISGEHLIELPDNHLCCGSAGLHVLKYPEIASTMLSPKISALHEIKPTVLLTSNTGCALHFKRAIDEEHLDIEVMHPAEWVSGLILNTE